MPLHSAMQRLPISSLAAATLGVLLAIKVATAGSAFDPYDWTIWATAAVPLVIAAIAQSQVILAGGQGLAAGSTVFLVNVVAATWMRDTFSSIVAWCAIGLLIGGGIGAFNGYLIGRRRLPSSAVTLATSFVAGGLALHLTWFQDFEERRHFRDLATGDLLGLLPVPVALLLILLAFSAYLDRSRLGAWIRAAGRTRRETASDARTWPIFAAYLMAGLGQAASGLFLAATIGASDGRTGPMISGPVLLDIYAAVILGGSIPYLQQGTVVGAALGALVITTLANLANVHNFPIYIMPAVVGLLLLGAIYLARAEIVKSIDIEAPIQRTRLPAMLFLVYGAILALVLYFTGNAASNIDPLALLLSALMAVSIGLVVLTGHIDLSLPSIIAFSTLTTAHLTMGSEAALGWAVPLVLGIGAFVGVSNALVSRWLAVPRLLVTLVSAGFLAGICYQLEITLTRDYAPPSLLLTLMNGPRGISGPTLVVALAPLLLLSAFALPRARDWLRRLREPEGRRSIREAAPWIHGFAGFSAAAIGVLLPGNAGQSMFSSADSFVLPALLAVQLAGLTLGRRGGNPLMLMLTTPLVVLLQILLTRHGFSLPLRTAILGGLYLMAIIFSDLLKGPRRSSLSSVDSGSAQPISGQRIETSFLGSGASAPSTGRSAGPVN